METIRNNNLSERSVINIDKPIFDANGIEISIQSSIGV
jgi:hypothetical protein